VTVIGLELRVMRVRKERKLVGLRVLGTSGKNIHMASTAWRHGVGRQAPAQWQCCCMLRHRALSLGLVPLGWNQ